jgi:hypothetical protein
MDDHVREASMISMDEMKKLAARGKASRREFIQFALASGITVVAAQAMFDDAVAATPKRGGSARFGLAHGATTDKAWSLAMGPRLGCTSFARASPFTTARA